MFVNFSNHPSSLWSENQRKEAEKYGEIVDLKFPSVNPDDSRDNLIRLAECYIQQILKFKPQCVMCQGEMLMYGREAQSKTKTASPATIPKSGERNRKIHSCMLYLISI